MNAGTIHHFCFTWAESSGNAKKATSRHMRKRMYDVKGTASSEAMIVSDEEFGLGNGNKATTENVVADKGDGAYVKFFAGRREKIRGCFMIFGTK